jgi:hypothetical protein
MVTFMPQPIYLRAKNLPYTLDRMRRKTVLSRPHYRSGLCGNEKRVLLLGIVANFLSYPFCRLITVMSVVP